MRATWIPVSERDPAFWQSVYATCKSLVDDRENWVIEGVYTPMGQWDLSPMLRDGRAVVVAWMPKVHPLPYKETDDDKRKRVSETQATKA